MDKELQKQEKQMTADLQKFLNENEKKQFQKAIAEYDYLQNDGSYFSSFDKLIENCFKGNCNRKLKTIFATYVLELDKIYFGNAFVFNNNANNVCKEYLKGVI